MSCTWTIINIYYNKLQKTMFPNSFIWYFVFGKNNMQSFFLVIMLAHYILFAPKTKIFFQGLGKGVESSCRLHYPFFDVTREKI